MNIFKQSDIQKVVKVNRETISSIEDAFTSLANGNAVMPPVMRIDIEEYNGEVDIKTAYLKGYDLFCIKISSGFFDNPKLGLPSGNGMMLLICAKTGVPVAILMDHGYLTDVRTAAAGAVSAKYLAPTDVHTVGIIGSGNQAGYQLYALQQVRDFKKVLVYGRTNERMEKWVRNMKKTVHADIDIAESPKDVVHRSQVVVTATPSKEPLLQQEWLHPGLHITAMGSDAEHKQELDPGILTHADVLVCDHKEQCFRLGELHHGLEAGVITQEDDMIELGDLTSGVRKGRTEDGQITVCDLTGTGAQDTAIANFAYHELRSRNMGMKLD